MKTNIKLLNISFMILGILFAFSCSDDLLEEKLYSNLGKSNLPEGVEGARQLVDGVYPFVQYYSYFRGNHWLLATEAGTDEFFLNWGGLPETGWAGRQNFLNLDPTHSQPLEMWDSAYQLIAQCNEVINNFESGASTDPQVNEVMAEAVFWRAYSYYKLRSAFGQVPLVTGNEDLSDGIAKAKEQEILDFVEQEMLGIENVLPETRDASNFGRPTKYAVKTFLAHYYLNLKDWSKASSYSKDVIDNGGFSLMDNYGDVFGIDANSEIILAIVHVAEPNKGNKYVALALDSPLRNALGIEGVSASNGYGMSVPFFNSFEPNDLRAADYDPETKQGIMVHGIIEDDNGISVYNDSNGNPIPVEEALNRVLSFKFPVDENIPRGEDSGHDFPFMRLGEVYLTYAEAQNELGNSNEALEYINPLRERANLDPLTINDQNELRNAILDERGWELYHEGYRREDLIRNGVLLEKIGEKWNYYFDSSFMYAGQEYRKLLPIPSQALVNNPLLTQNAGY